MKIARKIELLSPAKNLETGIEAINHGADAVYIGAPRFSARAAAGNTIADIEQLVRYAHRYFARVYVALNTILKEDELADAEKMIRQIYEAGADALIIQDMAIPMMDIPPIAIHASTQMDNRTPEKVSFLENAGFSQVVLARELSLQQIEEIAGRVSVPLEVFVHGALCVSYSGRCYLSQALSGRSANRGACAQYCRLPYTLQDATGKTLASQKHLLSLKDLNQSDHLEAILDAGASSLKIEGRLKELSYVKNVTAFYRKKLDEIFNRRTEYVPASSGNCTYTFTPDLRKSFNRGFTGYFLQGRQKDIASFHTPKSIGEPVGRVKETGRNYLTISTPLLLHNGDGLCFFDEKNCFGGFRVNKVESDKIFPAEMPGITQGTLVFRNLDHDFEKRLSQPTSVRKIPVSFILSDDDAGFILRAEDTDGCEASVHIPWKKERAQKSQEEQVIQQLSKLGNTIFTAESVQIRMQDDWFIPGSVLSDLRRKVSDALLSVRESAYARPQRITGRPDALFPEKKLSYLGNVSNSLARRFYISKGVEQIDPAFEIAAPEEVPLMFTKHCLRYSLGYCPRLAKENTSLKEPLYLLSSQGRLELEFDCRQCEMYVYKRT